MSDIVERLRRMCHIAYADLHGEAANEIERLRAALAAGEARPVRREIFPGVYWEEKAAPQPAVEARPGGEWRKLAHQFDAHRMQALAHLRMLLDNPQGHAEAARQFLAAPPPKEK